MTTQDHLVVRSHQDHPEGVPVSARRVTGWLRGDEARSLDDPGLVSSLGCRLHEAGLGFDRLAFHVGTLHPEVFARILAWSPNEPVEVYERDHPATVAAGFPESPFYRAAISQRKLVARALEPPFLGRAAGHLLQDRGVGELVAAPFSERNGRTVIVSFCKARPNAFSPADHLAIDSIVSSLQEMDRRHRVSRPSGSKHAGISRAAPPG
ncbi:MAG: adenylate cyclase [Tardiphaga sp.]|jgi:hypothetical protein|nr:adenylate cyclase [Tardiphaga sp.]